MRRRRCLSIVIIFSLLYRGHEKIAPRENFPLYGIMVFLYISYSTRTLIGFCFALLWFRREALQRWRKRLGSRATYLSLMEIFHKCGDITMVEELCQLLCAPWLIMLYISYFSHVLLFFCMFMQCTCSTVYTCMIHVWCMMYLCMIHVFMHTVETVFLAYLVIKPPFTSCL